MSLKRSKKFEYLRPFLWRPQSDDSAWCFYLECGSIVSLHKLTAIIDGYLHRGDLIVKLNRKNIISGLFTTMLATTLTMVPVNHINASGTNQTSIVANANSTMRKPIDYRKPSETKPYPNLKKVKNFWMKVSISKNRVYLYDDNHVIYTMYCSAGQYRTNKKTGKKKSMTPTGTFHIQSEHGQHFYNADEKEGGNYYTSWHDHGSYLFHSVPVDSHNHYIKKEAAKLGKSTASHGCVRLSIPDAKWIYQNVPVGTKVVVTN